MTFLHLLTIHSIEKSFFTKKISKYLRQTGSKSCDSNKGMHWEYYFTEIQLCVFNFTDF